MKLFQYWDSRSPPEDVAAWIEGFGRDNPGLEHVVFDAGSAAAFIRRHHGKRELAAFKACAVPAMQADIIRLCALDTLGGVYIDADHQSLQPLHTLLETLPGPMVFEWLGLLNNAVLVFREPHDPFVRACLDLAVANVEERCFPSVFTATGPGVWNAVRAVLDPDRIGQIAGALEGPGSQAWRFDELLERARALIVPDPALMASYEALTLMNPIAASLHIGLAQPAYKATDRHWARWPGSIYLP